MINLILPIRATQAVFSIILLGLAGFVAHWYNTQTTIYSPSQVNFLIVTPLISLMTLGYIEGCGRFAPRLLNAHVALGLEALNVLFYFSGFIALAVFLNSLLFCRGDVCGSARAATVFGAFQWLLFSASAGLAARELLFKSGGGLGGLRRGAGGAPSNSNVSQVHPSSGGGLPPSEKRDDSAA